MKRRNNAAKVIQRAWWRYIGKRYRSSLAQEMLQTFIVGTFNNSSLKIQALFRGWHSRRHIYNMLHLNMIQKQALEEILTNMVHKMRKINQRNELPGVLTFSDNRWAFQNKIIVQIFYTYEYIYIFFQHQSWKILNDFDIPHIQLVCGKRHELTQSNAGRATNWLLELSALHKDSIHERNWKLFQSCQSRNVWASWQNIYHQGLRSRRSLHGRRGSEDSTEQQASYM